MNQNPEIAVVQPSSAVGANFPLEAAASKKEKYVDLLATDFRKIYDVYMFHVKNRWDAAKFFVQVAIAPWIIFSFFGFITIQTATPPDQPKADHFLDIERLFSNLPPVLAYVLVGFGVIGLIPFHRFWNAHGQSYKMMQYLNHFRYLYTVALEKDLRELKWEQQAEVDCKYPPSMVIIHWTTMVGFIMLGVNVCYVFFGMKQLLNGSFVPVLGIVVFTVFHFYFYFSEVSGWPKRNDLVREPRDVRQLKASNDSL